MKVVPSTTRRLKMNIDDGLEIASGPLSPGDDGRTAVIMVGDTRPLRTNTEISVNNELIPLRMQLSTETYHYCKVRVFKVPRELLL